MTETPSLASVIRQIVESRLADLHTCMPGTIETYDPATNLASVQPSLMRKYVGGEPKALPIIPNVPVAFPRGGGAVIEFDIQKGDSVLLVFAERSLDKWITSGGIQNPKDPRKHALSDAVAYPGVYPKSKPASKETFVLSFKKDGTMKGKNANGYMEFDKDGNFKIDNGGFGVSFSKSGKVKLYGKNSQVDFIAQILLVIDKVMASKVATTMGLQPLIPDPVYAAERAKLDKFKE